MAKTPPQPTSLLGKITARLGFGRGYAEEIDRSGWQFAETTTTASLSGDGINMARTRQIINQKYQQMMGAPIVAGALKTQVTAALGGEQSSGKYVYIEAKPDAKLDPKMVEFVAKLAKELEPIFNREVIQLAYLATGFGDSYGRIYTKRGIGIVQLRVDPMVFPPLCIPFEVGGITRAVQVAVSPKFRERLEMNQIVRFKMPRMIYTPQPLAQEMAARVDLLEDDIDKLDMMPALIGGSFLADAEAPYDNFAAALQGLVGQRIMDSVDETFILANVMGLTTEQRQSFVTNMAQIFKKSKQLVMEAIKLGKPLLERIRHIIPVYSEKQVMTIQAVNAAGGSGAGRAGNIVIDDVMFHAKLLGGALGTDISMLGFADLMSGGLGDGGFFRTSAAAAEKARSIRTCIQDGLHDLINVHLWARDGKSFEEADRPWLINFAGSISALETESQTTKMAKANTTMLILQAFALARDSGLDEASLADLFETELGMDADKALRQAKAIIKNKKDAEAREAQQAGFGGGGGDEGGGFPGGGGDEEGGEEKPRPGVPKAVGASA